MAMARGSQLERRPLNLRAVPVGSSPIESFRRGTPRFWARVYRDALPDAQGWRSTACPASVWDPRVLPATKTRRGREKSNRPALPGRGRIVPEASGTLVLGPTNLPSHPFRGRRPMAPLRHSPPPSCGACPAPATATQRRAPPGAGAFRRGSRAVRGARESPWRRVAGGENAGGLQGMRSRGRKKGFGIPIRSPRWHAAHAEAVHIGLMPTMALSFKTFVSRRCKLSILRVLYVERQTHFPRQKKHLMFLLDIKLYHDTFTLILVMIKHRLMIYFIFSRFSLTIIVNEPIVVI